MKLCCFFVMVFLSAMLFAQEVSQSEALTMAQNFMSAKASRSMFLKPVSFETKGLNHMYFFTDESNTSFIVISREKSVTPIIAYSFESGLDEQLPLPVQDYFLSVETGINKAIQETAGSDKLVVTEWEMLATTGELPVYLKSAVAPLLTTKWNQDCYYNDSVPEHIDGPCGHCYAGCVATAMGQVMKYHNYPPVGIGSNIYGTGNYSNIHVDFSQATYNWAGMPNSITTNNSFMVLPPI